MWSISILLNAHHCEFLVLDFRDVIIHRNDLVQLTVEVGLIINDDKIFVMH